MGEPGAGDFGGVETVGFGDFLKNQDPDLLSGGCGEGGGGRVEEETGWGRAVETEEDCGEGVSFWGRIRR